MGNKDKRGPKRKQADRSVSDTSQDTSVTVSTPVSLKTVKKPAKAPRNSSEPPLTLERFFAASTVSSTMADKTGASNGAATLSVETPGQGGGNTEGQQEITPADVWKKLDQVLGRLNRMCDEMDDIRGRMYQVEQENTSLKEELAQCRKEMEDAKRVADEAKYEAGVARAQAGDLEQYGRRYNVRVFGVKEDDDETVQQCEEKVLRIINEKLELKGIKSADVDAIHRLGKKPKPRRAEQNHSDSDSDTESRPRAIIVRFVSRKCTQDVLRNRRKLRGTKISIAEDLARDRYRLLRQVKEKEVDDAWSRDGKIFVKVSGRIRQVKSAEDVTRFLTSTPMLPPDGGGRGGPGRMDVDQVTPM
ncbi:hypothetical protein BaRGS_00035320 [Batillaria attramentaria]|uniref:Uncharacterized protein n=1 Tax=Batillaria attramentaria TaxID=370345 RepID=A0ABD0JF98_9CAEN